MRRPLLTSLIAITLSLPSGHCSFTSSSDSDVEAETLLLAGLVYMSLEEESTAAALAESECTEYSEPLNPLYFDSKYGPAFTADQGQYDTILIGDSTMDLSANLPGFLTANVQSVAVSGNSLCDMIVQLPAINTTSPQHVVVSTAGGIDILLGQSNANIENSAELLVDALRNRFPDTQITFIGVHPTLISSVNSIKDATNPAIETIVSGEANTCWINPLPIFGVSEGDLAPLHLMLDTIHYNATVTLDMRDSLIDGCSVAF